tara:strand:+ start:24143 stop:24325 length:183 start_codon:yes stop_codon:yes gene_type:complete
MYPIKTIIIIVKFKLLKSLLNYVKEQKIKQSNLFSFSNSVACIHLRDMALKRAKSLLKVK